MTTVDNVYQLSNSVTQAVPYGPWSPRNAYQLPNPFSQRGSTFKLFVLDCPIVYLIKHDINIYSNKYAGKSR